MRLIPRNMERHPLTTTAALATMLALLIGLAHPHEQGWSDASDFFLGFAIALLIASFLPKKKARS